MIQKILGSQNVTVHVGNDGFEAVSMIEKNKGAPYDVVFMDVQRASWAARYTPVH